MYGHRLEKLSRLQLQDLHQRLLLLAVKRYDVLRVNWPDGGQVVGP